jgi:hypothetical protein
MANFDSGVKFVQQYLEDKVAWMDGSKPPAFFSEGAKSWADLFDKFSWKEDDQTAAQLHEDVKKADNKLPVDKERKYRMRTLFQAAMASAVRQQYMCGPGNKPRTALHSRRFEMANLQAVRGCLNKFNLVQDRMDKEQ